jgi:hypothetical protein
MQRRSRAVVEAQVAGGVALYERARCLPRVLPIMPGECSGPEPATTRDIVRRLADALRRERRLGRAGHWTYDLNRHIALSQAWRAERDRLRGARTSN